MRNYLPPSPLSPKLKVQQVGPGKYNIMFSDHVGQGSNECRAKQAEEWNATWMILEVNTSRGAFPKAECTTQLNSRTTPRSHLLTT